MRRPFLSLALVWAISPLAVGAEVACPSAETLHSSYEDSLRRYCDIQWQQRVSAGTISAKSYKSFTSSCMRRCLPKAAAGGGGHSSSLLLVGGIAALAGAGGLAAGGHGGGGKPASP